MDPKKFIQRLLARIKKNSLILVLFLFHFFFFSLNIPLMLLAPLSTIYTLITRLSSFFAVFVLYFLGLGTALFYNLPLLPLFIALCFLGHAVYSYFKKMTLPIAVKELFLLIYFTLITKIFERGNMGEGSFFVPDLTISILSSMGYYWFFGYGGEILLYKLSKDLVRKRS